ncbi:DUF2809 domain-containing protein [Aliirhizobium terrae]|uniref:ribosomal maturation YjgA family protein n=1 Tax=Terrirhizobium terrae TaxID=2926709 RepID=UPI002575BB0B|nr:DUF2809 domain-containing protein [Rhizobium sp. CC-CFT758]WJH39777.1 DUF2809 domain-containing protein [Rhizobium sp. CC-CFT758]
MIASGTFSKRIGRGLAALAVIAVGLLLRRFGYEIGLPFAVVKYGGSILWGSMVFLLVGMLTGSARIGLVALSALAIATAVEFSRLYHTPELDAFRLTTAGKLLLGRVFSLWNILAYATGIAGAAVVEARLFIRARGSAA